MVFQRGNKHGGRTKGAKNKLTFSLKEIIFQAANEAGGRGGAKTYLLRLARNDPKTFVPLLAKLVPSSIGGDPENPLHIGPVSVEVKFVDPQPKKGKTK